jgi:hypothetical protein
MRMLAKAAVSALAVAGIAGCAAPKYQVPGSVAQATFIPSADFGTTGIGVLRVQAFADLKCTKTPHGNRVATFAPSRGLDPNSGVSVPIEAGRDFVVTFDYGSGVAGMTNTSGCRVTSAFTPVQGATYRAHFTLEAEKCRVRFTDRNGKGIDTRPVNPPCFNAVDG